MQLCASSWAVQDKDAINFSADEGQVVREYTTAALLARIRTEREKQPDHQRKPIPV